MNPNHLHPNHFLTSVVRTVLPTGWGALLGAIAAVLGLPAGGSVHTIATAAVTTGGAWAVYVGARWVERQRWCPPVLARVLLGSLRQPVYPVSLARITLPPAAVPVTPIITPSGPPPAAPVSPPPPTPPAGPVVQ